MTINNLLEQVANSWLEKSDLLSSSELITALLEAEKITKKQKISYSFEQLIGNWQLFYVTGTKRKKSGISLGKGRYLPKFIQISLNYSTKDNLLPNQGTIKNCVNLGFLTLSLSGLVKFIPPRNMLVFDFTRMNINLFGVSLYDGYIRSGESKEENFFTEKVSKQAFFSYFYVSQSTIAARGRGGGIALWHRLNN